MGIENRRDFGFADFCYYKSGLFFSKRYRKKFVKNTGIFIKSCTFYFFYDTMKRKRIFGYAGERSNVIFVEAGRVFFTER